MGGTPEHVIELLSKNYIGVAQMANMVAEWLILGGKHISFTNNYNLKKLFNANLTCSPCINCVFCVEKIRCFYDFN